jgi:DNA repair photolyase
VERTLKITRALLEVLEKFNHPLVIITKSAGLLRDADILGRMAKLNLVRVYLSITTLNPVLARAMEPRAASPARRLAAITGLTQAGVPTGVLAAPMIPGLNDSELEQILQAASAAGAIGAGFTLLRLPLELADLFTNWLNTYVPERASHVLSLIRQMRGGKLNESNFHARFSGQGAYAEMLFKRFTRAAKQYGVSVEKFALDTTKFVAPGARQKIQQLSLF